MSDGLSGSAAELEKATLPYRAEQDGHTKPLVAPSFTVRGFLSFLTPEIFQARALRTQKLRSTAYLDGIRGLAALLVYISHHILSANGLLKPYEVAWGFENGNRYLINFPFLRLMFTGSHVSVPIFFIISGYVQARKVLQMIHENDPLVYTTIASACFRRGFRLFIPVLGSCFAFMTLWHLLGIAPYVGQYETTYLADVKYFFHNMWYWTYIGRTQDITIDKDHIVKQWFAYNGHTWTIPLEYQSSFHVMVLLMMFSKATIRVRTTMFSLIAFYFLLEGGVYSFCFPIGAALCELDLISSPGSFLIASRARYRRPCLYMLLALGFYLGGVPVRGFDLMSIEKLAEQPGFYYLSCLIPTIYFDITHFLSAIAGFCIVTAIIGLPETHKIFETRFLQYLGRISFSLYLCHGPILLTLSVYLYHIVGKITDPAMPYDNKFPIPQIGPEGLDLALWLPHIIILPVTLFASELCLKLLDGPSIKVAQWAWRQVSTNS